MLLSVHRRLYIPLNAAVVLLLLIAGVLAVIAPHEGGVDPRLRVIAVAAAVLMPMLGCLLWRRPTSGMALTVGIVALLAGAALLGIPGTGLSRVLVLISCVGQGALVVLCTFLRADDQAATRDPVVT